MPHHSQSGAAVILAVPAALLLAVVIIIGAAGGASLTGTLAACQLQPAPSGTAASIPPGYLADYQKAGSEYKIPWTLLAGIGTAESDNGQSALPGVHSGANPYGAAGPMQIGIGGAAGNTWGGAPVHPASEQTGGYGLDGDGDGIADVYDPGDAIPAAAAFLVAHGAHGNIPAALTAYNHSAQYVAGVMAWAARYAASGALALDAASSAACQAAVSVPLPAGTAGAIIRYAEAQLGKPYLWGATGPDAFDCSGLAMMAYAAAGLTIPRTSQAQWAFGTQIPASQAQPGDLVYFAGSDGTLTAPGHVGVVISAGQMIDSPYAGALVRQEPIADTPGLVGYTQPR
jgi:cell wall-associated NlpC family hydrolase